MAPYSLVIRVTLAQSVITHTSTAIPLHYLLHDMGNDTDEDMVSAIWLRMVQLEARESNKRHGGSLPGKSANIARDYAGAHVHFMMKNFWPSNMQPLGTNFYGPEHSEKALERRFRMPRSVLNLVLAHTMAHFHYLRRGLRLDAVGRVEVTPLRKVICTLRMLVYGLPSDISDDMFDLSETTASLSLLRFLLQEPKH